MTTLFTKEEQEKYRKETIEEYKRKAWSAMCHADWVADQMDKVLDYFKSLEKQIADLNEQIAKLSIAIDSHTRDNREKRKALENMKQTILPKLEATKKNMHDGYAGAEGLYQGAESNLAVAKYAEKWEWKVVEAGKPIHGGEKEPGEPVPSELKTK